MTFEEFELALAPSLGLPGKPSQELNTVAAERIYDYLEALGVDVAAVLSGVSYPPRTPDARIMLQRICSEFEAAIDEADRPRTGMGGSIVSDRDFAQAHRLPSVMKRIRWWAREFRSVLDRKEQGARHGQV